ncbi:MAG: sugar phosphate isomerase/epimerase [Verrucomicrobiales bacterium]|nr:sugar phosphate isomerase/epimerase [Verrucomicrobiales bacterium]
MKPDLTRRESLGAIGACIGLTPMLRPMTQAADSQTMALACGTYGLQAKPVADAVAFIAATGFDAAEISVMPGTTGDPATFSGDQRRAVKDKLGESGIRLCALMADLHPSADAAAHQEITDRFRGLCELARELSPDRPPLIQTVLGGKDWEASKTLFRDRLADWMQTAADQKIVLAVKPHRGNAMSRPADAIWLIEQLGGSPWLRMVYDYSHFHLREPAMPIAGTVAESLPVTAYVAAKDAVERDGKVVFALPGEGRGYDHADILRAFHAGGFRGAVCVEISAQIWKTAGYDGEAATRTSYRNLAAAFERAGIPRPKRG